MLVTVLAFGPIAEALGGRTHHIELPANSSARFLIEEIGMDMWLGKGLAISLNGHQVDEDAPLNDGDEIALLPPVSGG